MREVDSKRSDRIREMDRGMVGLDPELRLDENTTHSKATEESYQSLPLSCSLSLHPCLHLTHPPLLTLSFLFSCRSVIPCSIILVTCQLSNAKSDKHLHWPKLVELEWDFDLLPWGLSLCLTTLTAWTMTFLGGFWADLIDQNTDCIWIHTL